MKIRISSATLADTRYYPVLDVVLLIVESERHGIAVEDLEDIFNSAWFLSKGKSDRELLQLSAKNRSHDALLDKSVVLLDVESRRGGEADLGRLETRVHPLDAIVFLTLPFAVIVENEVFDGSFLLWMARALNFERIVASYRAGRFYFRHAGGKGGFVQSAEIISKGIWARFDGKYAKALQLWTGAILDSDSRFPGDQPNAGILAGLTPHVGVARQLELRSIENYLPQTALHRFEQAQAFRGKVDALFRMTEAQRNHYHMKRGFGFGSNAVPTKAEYMAADLAKVSTEEKALYSTVTDADWAQLAAGFGGGLSRIYYEESHRPSKIDQAALSQSVRSEMTSLLEEIYQRL